MAQERKKILIIGGGFGGVKTALELAGQDNIEVSLISDNDNFRYYPTLYQTATGKSSYASSIPLSEAFDDKDINVIKDSAVKIDRNKKMVKCKSGKTYSYDLLIVAIGVITNYFGIKGLEENSFGIKTVDEARELRDHLHKQLLEDSGPDINYIVIGGGPTGVELAGALPAYIHHIMKRHGLKDRKLHVDLVEAAPRLMPRMPRPYSYAIQKRLRKLGVKLYLGHTVEGENADSLMVSSHAIASHTVVWTAGVTNNPFLKENNFKLSDHGKVIVDSYLQAEPNIYVIGDNADTPYSGMAQTALYDAVFLAENIKLELDERLRKTYAPKRPVYVTPAGPGWAAVQWGSWHFYGRFGSFLRSVADFVGYHDYEPWWKASQHWMAQYETEESCPICATKTSDV